MKSDLNIGARTIVNALAPVVGIAMSLWILWNIETRFFPSVTEFKIQSAYQTNNSFTAIGTLNKKRNCEVVGMTIYRIVGDKPKIIVDQYKYDLFGSDAGTGEHAWGPTTIPLSVNINPTDEIQIVALHRCHALWFSQTEYIRDSWLNFQRYTLTAPANPNVVPQVPLTPNKVQKMKPQPAAKTAPAK